MRILIFSAFDPIPSDEAEIIRYARLANIFLAEGHEVTYVTSSFFHLKKTNRKSYWGAGNSPAGLTLKLLNVSGYQRHIGFKRFYSNYQLAREMNSFLKYLRKEEYPDLIITAAPPLKVNEVILRWAKKNGIKSVYDIQDIWPDEFMKFFPSWFPGRLLMLSSFKTAKKNIQLASAVTAVSRDYLNNYKEFLTDKPHEVFHLGIDTSNFKKADNGNVGPIIVHLGNSQNGNHWNNILGAIENINHAQLIIIGRGILPKQLLARFRNGNGPEITVKGLISKEEIGAILPNCNCGLLLLDERTKSAFPNRAFAYLAAGLPILNNIKGGELESLIREYNLGITIENTSQEELRNGINYCINKFGPDDKERIRNFAARFFNDQDIYKKYSVWALKFANMNG